MFNRCPFCKSKDVWQQSGFLCFRCDDCLAEWGKKRNPKKPQYKLNEQQSMFGTFCGKWTQDEMILLEESFADTPLKRSYRTEWFFFKGKTIYTAWRSGWALGNVIKSKTVPKLLSLIRENYSFFSS